MLNPAVTFTDFNGGSGTGFQFFMENNFTFLYYYLSDNTSCKGTIGDNPLTYNTAYNLTPGSATYNICAAVVAGNGTNPSVPSGTYTDTVYYTMGENFFIGERLISIPGGIDLDLEANYKNIPQFDGINPSAFCVGLRVRL